MKTKKQPVRIAADNDGGVEVTLTMTPETIASADKFAAKLGTSRNEVLRRYFEDQVETASDAIGEHCLVAWIFPTKTACSKFIESEGIGEDNFTRGLIGGGWIVQDREQAFRETGVIPPGGWPAA
jgi:hypothetical protein